MYNILICDDDADIRAALKIYLSSEGYNLFEAENGAQALEIAAREPLHLILLDVMMPAMDGIAATARLRQTSNVPIILLTAKSEDSDKVLGLNVGADDYVTKPFSVPELSAEVYETCRGKALELGMARIRPHLEHRSSFITALFVCDSMTEEAARAVRRSRHHKDFLLSLHGWMDFRAAAVDLATGAVAVNGAGRDLEKFIRGNLEKC